MLHQEFGLVPLLFLLPKPLIEMLVRKSLAMLPAHIIGLFTAYGVLLPYLTT